MRVVHVGSPPVEIDVCVPCQMLWLDAGERQALGVSPPAPSQHKQQQQVSHDAAVIMAKAKVAADAERHRLSQTLEPKTGWFDALLELLWWL